MNAVLAQIYSSKGAAFVVLWFGVSQMANADVDWTLAGHFRVNSDHRSWVTEEQTRSQLETIKLVANLTFDSGSAINIDVRHHQNVPMNAVRYAEFDWHLSEKENIRVGITRVPFGIQDFLSDSFWFSINYYLGLEDDYDLGAVYQAVKGKHRWQLGYFISDELTQAGNFDRYSFDVASIEGFRFKEDGQINVYYDYNPILIGDSRSKLGFSLQHGQVTNTDTNTSQNHYGLSAFFRQPYGPWQTTLQISHYRYDIPNRSDVVFSSFTFSYPLIRKANSYVLNQSYKVTNLPSFLDSLLLYSEYGIVISGEQNARSSVQWVTGGSFTKGPFVFYLDYVYGRNMWFSGGNGVGVAFPDDVGSTARVNFSTAWTF